MGTGTFEINKSANDITITTIPTVTLSGFFVNNNNVADWRMIGFSIGAENLQVDQWKVAGHSHQTSPDTMEDFIVGPSILALGEGTSVTIQFGS